MTQSQRNPGQMAAMAALLAAVVCWCFNGSVAVAQSATGLHHSEQHDFRSVTLASGLNHPWGLAFLPDGGILLT